MRTVSCIQCGSSFDVKPYRASAAKFCSYKCRGEWRSVHFRGEANPHWKGGDRAAKPCQGCGQMIEQGNLPLITFQRRKFCTKACADEHGFRFAGEAHPSWKGGKRPRNGAHTTWAERVVTRDKATCRACGATGVELHAHHLKPYKQFPELRYELSNGITLCAPCHWNAHSASNENAVNSGNPQHELGGGNPEPSPGRKAREGVTTRGRAYRRVDYHCEECGTFVSRTASDTTGRAHLFCGRSCAGRYMYRIGKRFKRAHGGNASTSAAPERDDIV